MATLITSKMQLIMFNVQFIGIKVKIEIVHLWINVAKEKTHTHINQPHRERASHSDQRSCQHKCYHHGVKETFINGCGVFVFVCVYNRKMKRVIWHLVESQ